MPRSGHGYQKACDIQKVLERNILDQTTDKRLIAAMAVAWERLAERKRIMKMQPKPRDLDVSRGIEKPRKREPSFHEPS